MTQESCCRTRISFGQLLRSTACGRRSKRVELIFGCKASMEMSVDPADVELAYRMPATGTDRSVHSRKQNRT